MANKQYPFDIQIAFLSLFIYAVNRFSKIHTLFPTFISSILRYHFNDYLGGITFAAYINLLIATARCKLKRIDSFLPLMILGIICSIAWEGLAPLVLSYSTGDWIDCIAYILGTQTYWLLNKKRRSYEKKIKRSTTCFDADK